MACGRGLKHEWNNVLLESLKKVKKLRYGKSCDILKINYT